ncbi:hypothetical protein QTI66_31170 [Variovorax sp. J22R133]|uniref:hypothetical protein n=1 Tax=Variovorax brevis TaxID=3053503 RepID=UPI002575E808|nr:hypothetical protein [Variovorax sp. J22R133]MDM0116608.1 hypothetical protein [Variovorax sp. J22R133]
MEDELRPVNVIRADLARAKDVLAALGFHTKGTIHSFTRHRVTRLAEELRIAEDAAMRLAETVALKWIYRYAGGKLLVIDESNAPKGP